MFTRLSCVGAVVQVLLSMSGFVDCIVGTLVKAGLFTL